MKVNLGPLNADLWSILYDGLIQLKVLNESHLVGYVDVVKHCTICRTCDVTQIGD